MGCGNDMPFRSDSKVPVQFGKDSLKSGCNSRRPDSLTQSNTMLNSTAIRSLNVTDHHSLEHRFEELPSGVITHSTIGGQSIRWNHHGNLKDHQRDAVRELMDTHPDTHTALASGRQVPLSPPPSDWERRLARVGVFPKVTAPMDLDLLTEIRQEITRINSAAGQTIFNPALTTALDSILNPTPDDSDDDSEGES